MSELKFLKVTELDGVVQMSFNRPKHNVFNIEMMDEINSELKRITADNESKCLVFLGQGPSWCAGVEVADHKPEMADQMIATFNRIFELIDQLEIPVIAAVHGTCLGGGMEVAIACDIVIASQKALFGQPEIKLGFLPPYAAIRLPQLVGPAKAIEICTTGKRYTAAEAQAMGFVNYSVGAEEFEDTVRKIVAEIQMNSPRIIRLNKRAVKQHLGLDFKQALQGVGELFLNKLMKTEDTLEGICSFEEKRKPVWKNR